MKKSLIALAMLAAAGGASAQLAFPGSSWSNLSVNPSVVKNTPEDDNVLFQGNIEQGIVWAKLGDWKVNTYGSLGYTWDRNGLSYNNKLVPAIGLKFQRPWTGGNFDVGIELIHQRNFSGVSYGSSSGTGVKLYFQYWTGWDLKR